VLVVARLHDEWPHFAAGEHASVTAELGTPELHQRPRKWPGADRTWPVPPRFRQTSSILVGTPHAQDVRVRPRASVSPEAPARDRFASSRSVAPRDLPAIRGRQLRRAAPQVRARRAPWVPPLRPLRARVSPCALRSVRIRSSRSVLVQGAQGVGPAFSAGVHAMSRTRAPDVNDAWTQARLHSRLIIEPRVRARLFVHCQERHPGSLRADSPSSGFHPS